MPSNPSTQSLAGLLRAKRESGINPLDAPEPNWFGDGGCSLIQWMMEVDDEVEREHEAKAKQR